VFCTVVLWFGLNGVVPHIFCIIFMIHVVSFNDMQSLVLSSTNHLLVGDNFLHAKFSHSLVPVETLSDEAIPLPHA
jgi:hypothetical protein